MSTSSKRKLFFYNTDKPTTVKEGDCYHIIIRHADMPLAEQRVDVVSSTGLLATDDKGSVFVVQGKESESSTTRNDQAN
ncbi:MULTISPECIES: hypothetical protein [Pseudomonas]|uniref:Uncharacterized protein n=1 Tax=Pseudomonas taiwanensis TaxID=470150 RepID=A0ABR6V9N0_9PSED|nr:hypothetical protein [Pseudomonas taiwanensis]MBC3477162.1 hypothetical protein [Pseudomonas taiwanensis]MBC3489976.1 hypothetical protein [Pseudomonas taiwanensis]